MVINFRVLEISRDMCKLTWITILIIKKISFLQNIYIYIYIYKRLKSGLKKWTCTHEIFNIMANRILVIKKPTNLGLHKGWKVISQSHDHPKNNLKCFLARNINIKILYWIN